MHHVDAERLRGRDQHRHDDQQDRRAFEHAAEQQQQDVDEDQEADRRQVPARENDAERLRDVLDRHDVVEDQRAGDQHADRGRGARAGQHRAVEVGEADAAIEHDRDEQRIGGRDRRRFGRRRDAAVDAAEQHDRHHQRREGAPGDAGQFAQRRRRLDREIVAARLVRRRCTICASAISRPGMTPPRNR